MSDRNEAPLHVRERIALRLILLAIKMVQPWKHDHKFEDMIKTIQAELDA
tara:strand:+ start:2263 stop:2412 length:150 start_codon:yes stop_codon:yes gene_type:complete